MSTSPGKAVPGGIWYNLPLTFLLKIKTKTINRFIGNMKGR
jgi:hypothetical protein